MTAAISIGLEKHEIDIFIKKIEKVLQSETKIKKIDN